MNDQATGDDHKRRIECQKDFDLLKAKVHDKLDETTYLREKSEDMINLKNKFTAIKLSIKGKVGYAIFITIAAIFALGIVGAFGGLYHFRGVATEQLSQAKITAQKVGEIEGAAYEQRASVDKMAGIMEKVGEYNKKMVEVVENGVGEVKGEMTVLKSRVETVRKRIDDHINTDRSDHYRDSRDIDS